MSGSFQKVIVCGNLGQDPDVRTTATGQMVATLSVATSERYTDKAGNKQESTEWHRVVVWGKLAELAQRYLSKGRKVLCEGKLKTRSWEDQQTGQKRYSTEIIASEIVFLDSGSGSQGEGQREERGQGSGGSNRGSSQGGYNRGAAPAHSGPPDSGDGPPAFDDDEPF